MDFEGFYIFVGDNQTHLVQVSYPFSIHTLHHYFGVLYWEGRHLLGSIQMPTRTSQFFVCVHYIVIGHCMQGTSCLCKHQCVQTFHLHTHEVYGLWMEMKYLTTGL
jgi:hypothetical protein